MISCTNEYSFEFTFLLINSFVKSFPTTIFNNPVIKYLILNEHNPKRQKTNKSHFNSFWIEIERTGTSRIEMIIFDTFMILFLSQAGQ